MALYKKECLEELRNKIDLTEVIGSHVQLKKTGGSYKALCPFHEEKTPSFMLQRGDTHYHCFGCGAHGDAFSFLMGYLKMSFKDSIEYLAERFGVVLEQEEGVRERAGPSKSELRETLQKAASFYHFVLLYTEEGHEALSYLYSRGIDLDFIRFFEVGFAPRTKGAFFQVMQAQSVREEILEAAGLIQTLEGKRTREFFSERIMFPIRDVVGNVIGFSGRKIKEEVFGGKYINTPETALFKKSQVLFGLSYCRKKIAKERKAIIVEGQIDALRLIREGFDFTVAGQGTAFGEGHVKEILNLGVNHVFLALDGDTAGQEATVKVGHLFQKKGVEVKVVRLPLGKDPDSLLREEGPEYFSHLLEESVDYLTFLVSHFSKKINIDTPSGKNELVALISEKIREWEMPVMVHESLRKLAALVGIPESVMGVENLQPVMIRKFANAPFLTVDPHRILETDLLRWIFLAGEVQPRVVEIAKMNLKQDHFRVEVCAKLFFLYLKAQEENTPRDLLHFSSCLEKEEDLAILSEIMERKLNLQKAEEGVIETIRKILQRGWLEETEAIKAKIQSGKLEEEEVLLLAKQFDLIKKTPPQVML